MPKRLSALLAAGIALGCAVPAGAASSERAARTVQEAWTDAATLRATEAHSLFEGLRDAKAGDPRDVAYGEALTLLDVQPKTGQNIDRAADLFVRLAKENPDDAVGQESRFFLARIAQAHRRPADPAGAERLYRELYRDHPESAVGQLALEKAALLALYANAAPAEIPARYAEFEKLGAGLTDPAAAVAFHLVMGLAAAEFNVSLPKAFAHLEAAEALGVPGVQAHAGNLVRLGRLAQMLGNKEAAARYWGEFVRLFPHDNRNFAIRQELAALAGGKAL